MKWTSALYCWFMICGNLSLTWLAVCVAHLLWLGYSHKIDNEVVAIIVSASLGVTALVIAVFALFRVTMLRVVLALAPLVTAACVMSTALLLFMLKLDMGWGTIAFVTFIDIVLILLFARLLSLRRFVPLGPSIVFKQSTRVVDAVY